LQRQIEATATGQSQPKPVERLENQQQRETGRQTMGSMEEPVLTVEQPRTTAGELDKIHK
jgi:hypothetical protein